MYRVNIDDNERHEVPNTSTKQKNIATVKNAFAKSSNHYWQVAENVLGIKREAAKIFPDKWPETTP